MALLTLGAATPALANGCNGYVNQFEWGCAAWDNNNGPQYPHYHGSARQPMNIRRGATAQYRSNAGMNVRGNLNAAGVIPAGAGNVIPAGAGN
jgi:hypothetical protein